VPVTLASFIVKVTRSDAIVAIAPPPAANIVNNRRRDVFKVEGEANMFPTSKRVEINLFEIAVRRDATGPLPKSQSRILAAAGACAI